MKTSLKCLVALLLTAAPAAAQVPYSEPTAEQVRTDMLSIHNSYRAQFDIKPLIWDEKLARDAAAYLAAHAKGGDLPPSPETSRPGQGENRQRTAAGSLRPYYMAESWASERFILRPGLFPNVSRTGQSADIARYSQMIWEGTTHIGCATRRVQGFDYLLCRYAPAGNVAGVRVP